MPDFQTEKQLIQDYHIALEAASSGDVAAVEEKFAHQGYQWRGFHPFNEISSPSEVGRQFWEPLKTSVSSLQRREDIFFAGENWLNKDGSVWVVSMGHLMGLFDKDWIGIPATQKMVMLRYSSFYRVANGKIAETLMYFDLPHFMVQAGKRVFPKQTAQHFVQPGPAGHHGLLLEPQPEDEGLRTRAAIDAMVSDLGQWNLGIPLEEELARTWHDDMLWWGPEGIGATYTIERYAKQHSGVFRAAFSDRSKTKHIARVAEGEFGAFAGWPNFTATLSGPFMGVEPTGKKAEFRVIDVYRRRGDKLHENWIFIDMLHFWKSQGFDVLADGLPVKT